MFGIEEVEIQNQKVIERILKHAYNNKYKV